MMKTLLITGGNGLLGSKLIRTAQGRYRLVSLDLQEKPSVSSPDSTYYTANVTDGQAVQHVFQKEQPDVVIHTAAFTDVDGAESKRDEAWNVNVLGTENVASACLDVGAKMIHLSTDYVFDGKAGPYGEDDEANPLGYYAETKWESEKAVQRILDNYVIARTMVLYGYNPNGRKNFVTWLIETLESGQDVQIVDDQFGNPTLADDLAEALLTCIEKDRQGIYHMAGQDWMNRYEFAIEIARVFDLDAKLIHKTTTDAFQQKAPRPLKSGLKTGKIQKDLGITFMSISQGLTLMKSQMKDVNH